MLRIAFALTDVADLVIVEPARGKGAGESATPHLRDEKATLREAIRQMHYLIRTDSPLFRWPFSG